VNTLEECENNLELTYEILHAQAAKVGQAHPGKPKQYAPQNLSGAMRIKGSKIGQATTVKEAAHSQQQPAPPPPPKLEPYPLTDEIVRDLIVSIMNCRSYEERQQRTFENLYLLFGEHLNTRSTDYLDKVKQEDEVKLQKLNEENAILKKAVRFYAKTAKALG
jgi:hypothetical protein